MIRLIALIDVVTVEPASGYRTRLETITASTDHLDIEAPHVSEQIQGTPFAIVTWNLTQKRNVRALGKYMDETEAAYVVVGSL